MKILSILIGTFFCIQLSTAQIQKIASHKVSISGTINLVQDKLTLVQTDYSPKEENKFSQVETQLLNNDLITTFKLPMLSDKDQYLVNLSLYFNGEVLQASADNLLGDYRSIKSNKDNFEIIWLNLSDELPASIGLLSLVVEVEYWGIRSLPYGVDCAKPPKFTTRQKIPYYTTAAIGLGGIVTGYALRQKALKHLDKHKSANTITELNDEYDRYSDQLKKAEIITYTGIGILTLDVILFYMRNEKHKKKIRVFEKYCTGAQDLSIHPYWDIDAIENTQSIGFHINYQF